MIERLCNFGIIMMKENFYPIFKTVKKLIVIVAIVIALFNPFYNQVNAPEPQNLDKLAQEVCNDPQIRLKIYDFYTGKYIFKIRAPPDIAARLFNKHGVKDVYQKEKEICQELQAKLHKDNNYCPPNNLACAYTGAGVIPANQTGYIPPKNIP